MNKTQTNTNTTDLKKITKDTTRLRNLTLWAWYLKGARDMLLMLRKYFLCEEPHPGLQQSTKGRNERKIYNKAVLDLLLLDKMNIDKFLAEEYPRFKDHKRNNKGKLTECRAYFAEKQ